MQHTALLHPDGPGGRVVHGVDDARGPQVSQFLGQFRDRPILGRAGRHQGGQPLAAGMGAPQHQVAQQALVLAGIPARKVVPAGPTPHGAQDGPVPGRPDEALPDVHQMIEAPASVEAQAGAHEAELDLPPVVPGVRSRHGGQGLEVAGDLGEHGQDRLGLALQLGGAVQVLQRAASTQTEVGAARLDPPRPGLQDLLDPGFAGALAPTADQAAGAVTRGGREGPDQGPAGPGGLGLAPGGAGLEVEDLAGQWTAHGLPPFGVGAHPSWPAVSGAGAGAGRGVARASRASSHRSWKRRNHSPKRGRERGPNSV